MFINRVSRRLLAAPEMAPLLRELSAGNDATLAVTQSARPLVLAALWAKDPRPCLLVVSAQTCDVEEKLLACVKQHTKSAKVRSRNISRVTLSGSAPESRHLAPARSVRPSVERNEKLNVSVVMPTYRFSAMVGVSGTRSLSISSVTITLVAAAVPSMRLTSPNAGLVAW